MPPAERPAWSERFSALDLELCRRQDGYREAALAHLTLLLVGVSRLVVDVAGDLRLSDEPLLAEVFGVIEERYREPLSLKGVARAVSLSPGHLTTPACSSIDSSSATFASSSSRSPSATPRARS